MKNIKSQLLKEPHLVCNLAPAIGLIRQEQCKSPKDFNKDKLAGGEYTIETIDGNHSSVALKCLAGEIPSENNFKTRQAILYAGLSNDDALYLGYRQNENTKNGKSTSTYSLWSLLRRKLITLSGGKISDDKDVRTKWHDSLRHSLNVQV